MRDEAFLPELVVMLKGVVSQLDDRNDMKNPEIRNDQNEIKSLPYFHDKLPRQLFENFF